MGEAFGPDPVPSPKDQVLDTMLAPGTAALALPSNVRLVPGDTGGCGDTTKTAAGVPDSTRTV
jgi:hypothetical protein